LDDLPQIIDIETPIVVSKKKKEEKVAFKKKAEKLAKKKRKIKKSKLVMNLASYLFFLSSHTF